MKIIVQPGGTAETRAAAQAAVLSDLPRISVAPEQLHLHADAIRSSAALPIGSVEYVRRAMQAAGMQEPPNLSYPAALEHLLRRQVEQRRAGSVVGNWFIKPVATKAFNGFVFDTMKAPEDYDEHDREQHAAFMSLSLDERVWVSEPVRFLSEWRYYVLGEKVLGAARYDAEGEEDAPEPQAAVVAEAVSLMTSTDRAPLAFAVDMGVLDSGETALVEVNDAWALGLYGRALTPRQYLAVLSARWQQIADLSGARDASEHEQRPGDTAGNERGH